MATKVGLADFKVHSILCVNQDTNRSIFCNHSKVCEVPDSRRDLSYLTQELKLCFRISMLLILCSNLMMPYGE